MGLFLLAALAFCIASSDAQLVSTSYEDSNLICNVAKARCFKCCKELLIASKHHSMSTGATFEERSSCSICVKFFCFCSLAGPSNHWACHWHLWGSAHPLWHIWCWNGKGTDVRVTSAPVHLIMLSDSDRHLRVLLGSEPAEQLYPAWARSVRGLFGAHFPI